MSNLSFNFNLVPVTRKRSNSNSNRVSTSVKRLLGVIWIDKEAKYYVKIHNVDGSYKDYELSKDSLTCKGREIVWQIDNKTTRFIQLIRNIAIANELTYHWKPFKPGTVVKGYINSLGLFEILKVEYNYVYKYSEDDKEDKDENKEIKKNSIVTINDIYEAQEFYRTHVKEIKINYKLKYGTDD